MVNGGKGFTLIELAVVGALIGVVMMVAYPRFSGLIQGRRLMGFCSELAGTLDYVRARAVLDTRVYYFRLDRYQRKYWVTYEGEKGEEEAAGGRLGQARSFPSQILLKEVSVESGQSTRYTPAIKFYPRGNADEAYLYFQTENGDKASIWVKPYTGRSEIFNYFYRD